MKKKEIIIGVIVLVIIGILIVMGLGYKDVNKRYDKSVEIVENLILDENEYSSLKKNLENMENDVHSVFGIRMIGKMDDLELKLDEYTRTSLDKLKEMEGDYKSNYSELTSDKYDIDDETISELDKQKSIYDEYKSDKKYKKAYELMQELIVNSERGESSAEEVEEKEEKAEAEKVLTLEEFIAATGLTEEEGPENYYEDYNLSINSFGATPQEALAATTEYIENIRRVTQQSDKQQVADNTPATSDAETNTTPEQNDSYQVTTPADNSQDSTHSQESQANLEDTYVMTEEEAQKALDELNGTSGVKSGLTEEQRERELEAWSGIEAY